MEASTGGGGQVRRLHIIYFLSRMGRIEHPHLIRVHHLTRNGVYLRDVKRWLADLRGQDMPEAFAWSYKRRYKRGYVWQDLLDDDLITPISDNEYVLKGSEIVPSLPFDPSSYDHEHKVSIVKNEQIARHDDKDLNQLKPQLVSPKEALIQLQSLHLNIDTPTPTKTQSEIYQESPVFGSERSSLTDDLVKHNEEDSRKTNYYDQQSESFETFSSSSFHKRKNKRSSSNNSTSNDDSNNDIEKTGETAGSSFIAKSPLRKSKSYSRGASMIRNLITCGTVDTNDAVLVMVNRGDKPLDNKPVEVLDNKIEICRGDKLGGSTRVFGTSWTQHPQQFARRSFDGLMGSKKKQSEYASPKSASAAYKPVNGPTCSQCGKPFKPEKMHTHMKSCRGMKALTKAATVSARRISPSRRSQDYSHNESISAHFLNN